MSESIDETNAPRTDLLIAERRGQILELVRRQRRATVAELADRFKTSLVTIRGDLAALAADGALVRTRGGALPLREEEEVSLDVKQTLNPEQKQRIAAEAARLIRDGETILLDSGTTTFAIARQVVAVADSSKLMRRNLSVIASVDQLDMLITDTAANAETVEELRRRGVEVRLV